MDDDLQKRVVEALWDYRNAQRRMRDKWAEGDENVKQTLWHNLHACEEKASAALDEVERQSEEQE